MRLRCLLLVVVVAGLTTPLVACGTPSGGPPSPSVEPVDGTWVDVVVDGDTVVLPSAQVQELVNLFFSVDADGRTLDFMAYLLEGDITVRANACPPCRSRGFALDGDVLVCDACQTTFDARDGSGVDGACVDYPKAAVQYRMVDGNLTMSLAALVAAYDETLIAG